MPGHRAKPCGGLGPRIRGSYSGSTGWISKGGKALLPPSTLPPPRVCRPAHQIREPALDGLTSWFESRQVGRSPCELPRVCHPYNHDSMEGVAAFNSVRFGQVRRSSIRRDHHPPRGLALCRTSKSNLPLTVPIEYLRDSLIVASQSLEQDLLHLLNRRFGSQRHFLKLSTELAGNRPFDDWTSFDQPGTPGTIHTQLNKASPLAPRSLWLHIDLGQRLCSLLATSKNGTF